MPLTRDDWTIERMRRRRVMECKYRNKDARMCVTQDGFGIGVFRHIWYVVQGGDHLNTQRLAVCKTFLPFVILSGIFCSSCMGGRWLIGSIVTC